MRQRPTATLASVAAAALLAACGSSGVNRLRPNGPITRAEALAAAQAISLRRADAPTLKRTAPGGMLAPTQREVESAKCGGGASPALRVAYVASPTLEGGDKHSPFSLASFVAVWPTAAVATQVRRAEESARGVACAEHALGEPRTLHEPDETLDLGRARVIRLPAPILGARSIAFQTTATLTETFPSTATHYVFPFYLDILTAGVGPIGIAIEVHGRGKAPPPALAQRLLARLYDRAKARVRRATGKTVLVIK
jgi:hypothetical protein